MKRNWLLLVGIVLTGIVSILSFTPLDWIVEKRLWGVPDEYYPEVAWLMFGLPVALLVLIAGLFLSSRWGRKAPEQAIASDNR
ncbi:MAG TPA: hypothetical protein VHZ78_09830 [Rhizomicrobium sp.]|jgi:hypothetical protein|nr:hypothetical protein [Rhizomicrobium sp.]